MRYAASCTDLTIARCHLPAAGGQLGRESFVASSRVLTAPVGDTGAIVDLDTDAAHEPAGRRAVAGVRDRPGDLLGPPGYVNYIDPDLPDRSEERRVGKECW